MEFNNIRYGPYNLIPYMYTDENPSSPQGQCTGVCRINRTPKLTCEHGTMNKPCFFMDCSEIVINDITFHNKIPCTNIIHTTTSVMTITSCIMQKTITITNTAISSIVIETISASRPWSTTSVFPTTTFPTANSCGHLATTLHGVYMTVLLVLVAVTITMTTLVVYMCLMMRRAKSGRVPQTTTGTTHTNNMAASDYCDPISLRHVQNINGGM